MKYYEQIKQAREALNLTQREMADMAGVKLRQYQYIEAGRGSHTATLEKLCKKLGITLEFPKTME